MSSVKKILSVAIACASSAGGVLAQQPPPEPADGCTYSITNNGPTWSSDRMNLPPNVLASAFAHDGVYGGAGFSKAYGLSAGGAGVAVASVVYWYKVTHLAAPDCKPVEFESEATVEATVSTSIHGESDDYALAAGFQAVSGVALGSVTLAVAATNAGAPVSQTTLSVSFGLASFTITIPGVSVTSDRVDRDHKSARTSGKMKIEEETITANCWVKTKVVTDGPFGGYAYASIDYSHMGSSTTSKCEIHQTHGYFSRSVTEG